MPRVIAHAIACAVVLTACDCQSRTRELADTRAPDSNEPPIVVVQPKVDPLQPPPRDPIAPEDVRAPEPVEVAKAPTVPSGPFDPALLTGTWSGTYIYNVARGGAASVGFFADLAFEGPKLSGSMVEPNTFGDDSSGELKATLVGRIDDAGIVRFTKTYDGSGGIRHTVEYIGRLDVAAQRIEGTWSIDGASGRFVMMRQNPLPQLAVR
ncbi:MAG TPA: hypothetical protein VG755_45865 [Nannocystaceae bacterium]|nr:hypothetical protein [Nannocystaceae bacterium]